MGRGLGHLAAPMKDFIKYGSQIEILKIPQILMKISKYSIRIHSGRWGGGERKGRQKKTYASLNKSFQCRL